MPMLNKPSFFLLNLVFELGLIKICYETKPDLVMEELKEFIERTKESQTNGAQPYRINFYENNQVFFIDLSGTLKQKNLKAFRLMFKTYLGEKAKKLRGVVFLFNNTDETSSNFITTWSIFRFWEDIGVPFNKVFYLSLSERITNTVDKYASFLGVKHLPNLIDAVKVLFPEKSNDTEEDIFNFASDLLSDPKNK